MTTKKRKRQSERERFREREEQATNQDILQLKVIVIQYD